MNITVIGCGRWGSFLGWYLNRTGHSVLLYGRAGSNRFASLLESRTNEFVTLPDSVKLSSDLDEALAHAEVLVISVSAQSLRAFASTLPQNLKAKAIVLCMKGIECDTGLRLTQVLREYVPAHIPAAIWVGPGHVQSFVSGCPNCMVIDSDSTDCRDMLIDAFSGDLIRFYYGTDLIGNEIGAAAKNVIGIAAGMLDGLNLTPLKGALMARGTREVAKLIAAMGGKEQTAYGLGHLGDYEATVFSPYSHNRRYGEAFVKGEAFSSLAEGVPTAAALKLLADRHGVELPILESVHRTLSGECKPAHALDMLFTRTLKAE